MSIICVAIRTRSLLEFDYHGLHRVVAPYCHGTSRRGGELLRAIQIRGGSHSGPRGFGKLWLVAELVNLRLSLESFVPDELHYNPSDRSMYRIHCRI